MATMENSDAIDWQEVRRRVRERAEAQLAAFVPPPPKKPGRRKLVKGTPEYEEFRQKENERNRRYRKENPEKARASNKAWCKANPEKVKAKKHRNYERHKEEIAEKKRLRRLADPEKIKRQKHESYLRCKARRLAALGRQPSCNGEMIKP